MQFIVYANIDGTLDIRLSQRNCTFIAGTNCTKNCVSFIMMKTKLNSSHETKVFNQHCVKKEEFLK